MRIGVLAALAVVLTACGIQPESAPATTEPAATTAAPTSAPATTAADEDDDTNADAATAVAEDEGVTSPVAGVATPVGMTAATPVGMAAATPVGSGEMMASPVAGAAEATPVHRNRDKATPVGEAAAFTVDDCPTYLAWQEDPAVQVALAYEADWPLIVAEGEKAAAGEPVDSEAMKALYDKLSGTAKVLRASGDDELGHDAVAFAGKAMGLASRMAGGLSDGSLTRAEAGDAVVDLQAAIDRYEDDAAARQAVCA